MNIIRKEYTLESRSHIAPLFARCWMPDGEIKAIFQITHGMAEHGERYEDFAKHLCEKGFAVLVNDHIGHGKSINSDDDLGYFGEEHGWDALVVDSRKWTEFIENEIPDVPVIYYGHSMGSFIGREYLRRYSRDERIKGAIICGTAGKNPAAGIAIKLADTIAKVKGSKFNSKFINNLAFGSYNKKIKKPKTEFDWLSTDEAQVSKYIADRYCGFLFTAVGYRDLFTVLSKVNEDKWFTEVNPELPMLLTAGTADPVGNYGAGVKEVYDKLIAAGCKKTEIKLYGGMRHEIHNEVGNTAVYEDLANWALDKIK